MLANESYLQKRKVAVKINKSLLVPFTSDKGLCGGVNTQIIREVRTLVRPNKNGYRLFLVGEKVDFIDYLKFSN